MTNQVQVNGGNSAMQGIQGGQKGKKGQFVNRGLSPNPKIPRTGIREKSNLKIPDRGSSTSKALKESYATKPVSRLLGSMLGCLRTLIKWTGTWILNEFILGRTSDIALFQPCIAKNKISNFDPSKLSKDGSLDRNSRAGLIERRKVPPLVSLKNEQVRAPRVIPRVIHRVSTNQILKGAIGKAFFGKTDGIDDRAWASVRTRLPTMTLVEARGIWQTIANAVAVDCLDAASHVDAGRVRTWMAFFKNVENFREEPLCLIPHAELMRFQMYTVCESLVVNRHGARDQLNAAAGITVGPHGQDILETMSQGRERLLNPAEAILASLFTPHRQQGLPTCTMDSTINTEMRNHLRQLIETYKQILERDQFTFSSGYVVQQQRIEKQPEVNSFITIDLKNGGKGRNRLFKNITDGDPAKITKQIARWEQEGIEYTTSTNPAEKYKLKMPIRNINDVLFAHFILASNFGNRKICSNSNFGTMLIYAGQRTIIERSIQVHGPNFLVGIAGLKMRAADQKRLGNYYMHVVTRTPEYGHGENIDIDALLALNPDTMEIEKAYPIGDRNWAASDMSQDIPRLAVRKVDGIPPTFEFGTLKGSIFKKEDILDFRVYPNSIRVHDAQYWEQFRP